jgi:hypothetical protein
VVGDLRGSVWTFGWAHKVRTDPCFVAREGLGRARKGQSLAHGGSRVAVGRWL